MGTPIGDKIKELRIAGGYTYHTFAAAMGICTSSVHNWESGKSHPSQASRADLCKLFSISDSDLPPFVPRRKNSMAAKREGRVPPLANERGTPGSKPPRKPRGKKAAPAGSIEDRLMDVVRDLVKLEVEDLVQALEKRVAKLQTGLIKSRQDILNLKTELGS